MCKKFFLTIAIFFTVSVLQAQSIETTRKAVFETLPICGEAVFSSFDYLAVSPASSNTVQVVSLSHPELRFDIHGQDQIVDVKIVANLVYILTQTSFEIWNIQTRKSIFLSASHAQVSRKSRFDQRASGFILKDNLAIISHGSLGFSILNTQTGRFEKFVSMPTKSVAKDIAMIDEMTAVVAVDSDNEPNFRGIYVMDLKTFSITRQIRVDNAFVSGIRILDQKFMVLIYFNAIWKFDLASSIKARDAKPIRRQPTFPGVANVNLVGKVFFDDVNLYACFQIDDPKNGLRQFKPMAISLKALDL